MNLITKLERKLGWLAVGHLPIYIVSAQGIIVLWSLFNPGGLNRLILDPYAFWQGGEYFRILTFLFVTPIGNPLFTFLYLFFIYSCGAQLEHEIGSFHLTLFYLIGVLGTSVAAVLFGSVSGLYYVNLTLILAMALSFPNHVIYLIIIPIKMKWLAVLELVLIGWEFIVGPPYVRVAIAVAMANFGLFFGKMVFENLKSEYERLQHKKRFKDWNNNA